MMQLKEEEDPKFKGQKFIYDKASDQWILAKQEKKDIFKVLRINSETKSFYYVLLEDIENPLEFMKNGKIKGKRITGRIKKC